MAEPAQEKMSRKVVLPQGGKGAQAKGPRDRYCAFCGGDADVHGLATERFGEVFCTDGHAQEFVKEVRAARIQVAAAARAVEPSAAGVERPGQPGAPLPKQMGLKGLLKMAICCGAPLLALVVLAGGGGALLGAAGAIAPFLLLLACPLGMYFMMRSMSNKTEQKENAQDKSVEDSGGSPRR